jgi:hypothetical protein
MFCRSELFFFNSTINIGNTYPKWVLFLLPFAITHDTLDVLYRKGHRPDRWSPRNVSIILEGKVPCRPCVHRMSHIKPVQSPNS